MEAVCPFAATLSDAIGHQLDQPPSSPGEIPLMPLGQAADMGHAPDGTPLIDPRLFSSAEYNRNPYPCATTTRCFTTSCTIATTSPGSTT
jgi:hypothetical protein